MGRHSTTFMPSQDIEEEEDPPTPPPVKGPVKFDLEENDTASEAGNV